MFKYYNAVTNRSGDGLAGYYVRLFASNGDAVDIFSDDSGTPIASESGVSNAAKSDDLGNVSFYVENGTYDIRFYDTGDDFKSVTPAVPMYDAGAVSSDLASTDMGKGAALIGTDDGSDVQTSLDSKVATTDLASSSGGAMVGLDDGSTLQETTNALAFGTFDDAASANAPSNIGAVDTRGYTDEGVGGARYYYDAAVDPTYVSNNPRSAFISTNGRGFKLGEREPSADMFGALADDGTGSPPDATAALNYLGAYFEDANPTNVFGSAGGNFKLPPNMTFRISASLHLPWFMGGVLNGARFVPITGTALSAFDNDSMINLNVDSSGTQLKPAGGLIFPRLSNFTLWNNPNPVGVSGTPIVDGLEGIYSKSRIGPHNFATNCLWRSYVKAGSAGSEYIDGISIGDVFVYGARGSDYPISLFAFGDNLEIGNIVFQIAPDNAKGIYVQNCRGARVGRIINGAHLFTNCDAMDMTSFHLENGTVEFQSVGGVFRNGHFYNRGNVPFITINSIDSSRPAPPFTIEQTSFNYNLPDGSGYVPSAYDADIADININTSFAGAVSLRNVHRKLIPATTSGATTATAAKVARSGTILSAWENNASWNARASEVLGWTVNPIIRNQPQGAAATITINSTNNAVWREASATYYYRWVALVGPRDRMCGRVMGGGERSAAKTNGGDAAIFTAAVGSQSTTNPGFLGMTYVGYRGTSTGSYTHRVYVPLMGAETVVDCGFCMGTGEMWTDLGSGISLPSFNTVDEIRLIGVDNVEIKSTAAPTVGTWKKGDRAKNTAAAADGNNMVLIGWECTAAGTPGTWTPQYVSSVSPAT